jgi:hypothetical protein
MKWKIVNLIILILLFCSIGVFQTSGAGLEKKAGLLVKPISKFTGINLKTDPVSTFTDCYQALAKPEVTYTGAGKYTGSDGNQYTRHSLAVSNVADYPSELFSPAPDLPPCGLNTKSSRTWVNIYNEAGEYLYGFCSLGSPKEMGKLWFSVPAGDTAPSSVTVQITDRACNRSVSSEGITISPALRLDTTLSSGLASTAVATGDLPITTCPGNIILESDTDRVGSDLRAIELVSGNPCECAKICEADPECQAFTFIRAGVQGSIAKCWIKNGVPDPETNPQAISGVKKYQHWGGNCSVTLAEPRVKFDKTTQYSTAGGEWTRYNLILVNTADYPDFFFFPSPDLPPCGENTEASRTWMNIYSRDGSYLYGYCAAGSALEIARFSFALPEGTDPPSSIYVEMNDRLCNRTSRSLPVALQSDSVSTPQPASGSGILPAPVQVYPENGAVFDVYPRVTKMAWEPVPGAATYTLEADCYHCCEINSWCTDAGETYQVKSGLITTTDTITFAGRQKGRWRVWAVDSTGTEGRKSPWREFEYTV